MSHPVTTAVIPAAGLGTRLLPATKVVPKELLAIGNLPLIQFALDEIAASGLLEVIVVVGHNKNLLERYLESDADLENVLNARGLEHETALIHNIPRGLKVRTVSQASPLGLADAIRSARPLVGKGPFAVLLPDVLFDTGIPCTLQLMKGYEKAPGCIIATGEVDPLEMGSFGMLELAQEHTASSKPNLSRVCHLVERPDPGTFFSTHGIFGRYILEPEIFDFIDRTSSGRGGEVQLTDALNMYKDHFPVHACHFEGTHYDAGTAVGLLRANLAYALRNPELAIWLRNRLPSLEGISGVTKSDLGRDHGLHTTILKTINRDSSTN